jgi:hypothetical protein
MTTLTIKVGYTLSELREKYRAFFGFSKTVPITKEDIEHWLGRLAEADIQ